MSIEEMIFFCLRKLVNKIRNCMRTVHPIRIFILCFFIVLAMIGSKYIDNLYFFFV